MTQELLTEEEVSKFLDTIGGENSLKDTNIDTTDLDLGMEFYKKNIDLIKQADKEILSRIKYGDESLTIKDLIGVKAEAFKQNQLIRGKDTEIDSTKIIPTNIHIQINTI